MLKSFGLRHRRARRPIAIKMTAADEFSHIGKETDRRWEREEDFSLLAPRLQVYRPNETKRLVAD
jgi:hypothetical protein